MTRLVLLVALAAPTQVRAESWCANPIVAHEWGVQVFTSTTATGASSGPGLPSYFHDHAAGQASVGPPVRHLPIDIGIRKLPIVQFYAAGSDIPLGLEVGFTLGESSRWYPQVDHRSSAEAANGAEASAARERLLAARAARTSRGLQTALPADPTRQLEWARLELSDKPRHARSPSDVDWIGRLRSSSALWVNGAAESDRFVFYEANTREQPAIKIERGPTFGAKRHHYVLRNVSSHPVHDVFLVQRDSDGISVFFAPAIPPGAYAGALLEEHRVPASGVARATRDRLRQLLVEEKSTPQSGECVMRRDPAIPVERASGHRLYAAEADLVLDIWSARFFEQPGTTLVYREDAGYLDTVMPLSIYTDMYHFVELHRAGLALVTDVRLP
jgi:hypothetical protein